MVLPSQLTNNFLKSQVFLGKINLSGNWRSFPVLMPEKIQDDLDVFTRDDMSVKNLLGRYFHKKTIPGWPGDG